MANEFIARKGLIALDSSQITGSLSITGAITGSIFTGSFKGDGSQLSGVSAGFPFTGSATISGSLQVTGSVSATAFIGDGSQLTGIADPTPITATINNTNSPFTVTSQSIVIIDSTNGDVTVNLPDLDLIDGTPDQKPILLYKNDYSQNVIYVQPSGSQLVNGTTQDIIVSIQIAIAYNPTSAGWVTEGTSYQSLAELEMFFVPRTETGSFATTGSNQFSGSQAITGSLTVTGDITGNITGSASTASYVEYTNVANKPALVSGSSQITYSGLTGIPSGILSGSAQIAAFGYATTGSNGFNGNQAITGSLTVTGQVVAQTLNVQQVTSSIVYSSGSNIFGNSISNTQQFTGSLQVTGSSHYLLGSVGVGVTSPLSKFHVNTGTNQNFRVRPGTDVGATNGVALNSRTDDDGSLQQLTLRASDVIMLSSGNVGIGTASPSRTLHILGASGIGTVLKLEGASGTTTYLQLAYNGATDGQSGYIGYDSSANMSFFTSNTERMLITSGGSINFSGTDATTQYYFGYNRPTATNLLVNGTNNNKIRIQNVESDVVVLNSNGNSYFNGGNVGINTSSPGTKLEVSSTAPIGDRTLPHNILTLTAEQSNAPYGGFGGAILFKNRSYVSGLVESSRIRSVIYDDGAPNNFGGGLWFETTPTPGGSLTPSLIINYAGNVGIGTTSPGNFNALTFASPILDVVGSLNVRGIAANGASVINMGGETYRKAAIYTSIQDQGPYLGFAVGTSGTSSNTSDIMRLTSSGNVLIGTTSNDTNFKLRVGGNIRIDGFQKMYTYYIIVQPNTTGTVTISSPTGTNMQGSMQVIAGGYGNSLSGNVTGLWMVGGLLFFDNSSTSTITQIVNSVTANGSMSFQRSSDQYTVTLANTSSLYTKTLFVSVIINGD